MSSTTEDQSKTVTGYPHAQSSYYPAGYPPAQPSFSTAGVAYPYTAPPPATYYNNTTAYPAPLYNPQRTTFLRRLLAALIALFLIFGSITFILWLVLRPHLPIFRVDSGSVSAFNVSASQITANWDVVISARNPNKKMSISYDRLEASIFYRDEFLSETSLPPFYQGKKNETTVRARFAALSGYIDGSAASEIVRDRSHGAVNFNLRLLAWVSFRTGEWRTRKRLMSIYCGDTRAEFGSNGGVGTLLGGSEKCKVDL